VRHYIKIKDNVVISETISAGIPGATGELPGDMLDVTDRVDGPWVGKSYDSVTDTFAAIVPVIDPKDAAAMAVAALDVSLWKQSDRDVLLLGIARKLGIT